jgi:glucose/arabinose dehydrogenase
MKNTQMTIGYRPRPYTRNRFTYAIRIGLAALCTVSFVSIAFAQNPLSVSRPEADNSVAAELKSFALADGYQANLFADESDGVANPVCMSWDPAGRLWVLCTWAYPQAKPVDKPDDKLLILTDTNGDGRADKTTVFADGLNMPTGFAIGHGGAYIGEGNDLLHLEDTDGDDQADTRRVLLTGFGTGDTHQNINSFTWSPGGEILFCPARILAR